MMGGKDNGKGKNIGGLKSSEDYGGYEDTHEKGALIGNGVNDWVFVEFSMGGEEPELGDPEQQDRE